MDITKKVQQKFERKKVSHKNIQHQLPTKNNGGTHRGAQPYTYCSTNTECTTNSTVCMIVILYHGNVHATNSNRIAHIVVRYKTLVECRVKQYVHEFVVDATNSVICSINNNTLTMVIIVVPKITP